MVKLLVDKLGVARLGLDSLSFEKRVGVVGLLTFTLYLAGESVYSLGS